MGKDNFMRTLFKDAKVYENSMISTHNYLFDGVNLSPVTSDVCALDFDNVINGVFIFPGFCDVHVHFREPGFS